MKKLLFILKPEIENYILNFSSFSNLHLFLFFLCKNSGRTGEHATLHKVQSAGIINTTEREFSNHGLWVSVPGAVGGMCSVIKNFGSGKVNLYLY